MKRFTTLAVALLVLALGVSRAQAQATLYWDDTTPGNAPGLIVPGSFADGTWDTSSPQWSTSALGDVATQAWNDGSSPADNAVFRIAGAVAGPTPSNPDAVITISTARTVGALTFDNGVVDLDGAGNINSGAITINNGAFVVADKIPDLANPPANIANYTGVIATGTADVTINAGGRLNINSTSRLTGTGRLILNGGRFTETNPGSAGTFLATGRTIEVNGTGTIGYSDGGTGLDDQVSIYSGTITGTGGTTSNGGAGTLVVNGTDQLGVASNANMTFAKLVVDGGSYRGRNVSSVVAEQTFGAVPLASLPDAITLMNNGAIGSNASLTFNVNRGITIGTGGGRISGIGLGTLTVPGPLTSAGGNTLQIDGRNLTVASATFGNSGGGITLTNANNTTTFVNTSINIDSSTITLNESLNAASLSGASQFATGGTSAAGNLSATATGTVTIAAGKTFTVGSNNANSSYAGRVTGAGTFTKVGNGELLLNTIPATTTSVANVFATVYSGEWSNTGGININGGSIKYGNTNSGFATTAPVAIASGAKLNMNGINDTFGSLAGPTGAIVDMKDVAATAGNLTLAATTGTTTYSGTIVGGGNLTKSAASVQILGGATTLGTVAANSGSLINDAAMATSGGVTVGAAGTLGGTGSIVGAITNNGIIAPGDGGVGTLSVTGNVTNGAASSWSLDLSGATADKLAVTGNIDLSVADTLTVAGTGSGTSWTIASYTGSLTGTFDTIPSGYTVNYGTGANSVITLNSTGPGGVAGDYNGNGVVDMADYVLWRNGGPLQNEVNSIGVVDSTDYDAWRARFGNTSGSGSSLGGGSAVPEPTSLVLVVLCLGGLVSGRRAR